MKGRLPTAEEQQEIDSCKQNLGALDGFSEMPEIIKEIIIHAPEKAVQPPVAGDAAWQEITSLRPKN